MKYVVTGAVRAAVLGLLWIFLAGWDADYAVYGVVSVAAATALSLTLLPPQTGPDPARWPRRMWFSLLLALWFLWQSARGGVDVARRAVTRAADIEPAVVVAAVRLPRGHALQLAMLMMNLMPGSMVQRGPHPADQDEQRGPHPADQDEEADAGEVVEIHTLSQALNPAEQWRQLQLRAGRAFD